MFRIPFSYVAETLSASTVVGNVIDREKLP